LKLPLHLVVSPFVRFEAWPPVVAEVGCAGILVVSLPAT
jgi:hypothetical protein